MRGVPISAPRTVENPSAPLRPTHIPYEETASVAGKNPPKTTLPSYQTYDNKHTLVHQDQIRENFTLCSLPAWLSASKHQQKSHLEITDVGRKTKMTRPRQIISVGRTILDLHCSRKTKKSGNTHTQKGTEHKNAGPARRKIYTTKPTTLCQLPKQKPEQTYIVMQKRIRNSSCTMSRPQPPPRALKTKKNKPHPKLPPPLLQIYGDNEKRRTPRKRQTCQRSKRGHRSPRRPNKQDKAEKTVPSLRLSCSYRLTETQQSPRR